MRVAGLDSIALLLAVSTAAYAGETASSPAGQDATRKAIEEYCTVVTDLAAERRVEIQAAALKALDAKVTRRLDQLESKSRELADLIRKREELRNLADSELVDIYAGMDAEAAAAQMEKLDLRLSSSVLRQLKPRQASAILNVMKPELAAQLVRLIAVAAAEAKGSP